MATSNNTQNSPETPVIDWNSLPKKPGHRFINKLGRRFGRLIVVKYVGTNQRKQTRWECLCDCGNNLTVSNPNLGISTNSCGCLEKENRDRCRRKHSNSEVGNRTPEYTAWVKMRERCLCYTNKKFSDYGGRGISISESWLDFSNFLRDMGPKPEPKHLYSIDRIDVNGNYESGNCRWATRKQQNRNKRNTFKVVYKGEELPLKELCEREGKSYSLIIGRLKMGWSLDKALREPKTTNNAVNTSAREISRLTGAKSNTVRQYLRKHSYKDTLDHYLQQAA